MSSPNSEPAQDAGYQTIFECSQDAILVVDPDGEIVLDGNPAAMRLYGRTRERLIGMSMLDVAAFPERPRRIPEILRRGYLRFETTHLRTDGAPIELDIHATVIDFRGRRAILSINRDMTFLLDSERRHRSLLANVPAVLWTVDSEWNVHFVSSTCEQISGYPAEAIMQSPSLWASRIHPDDLARVTAAYAALFNHGAPFAAEYRFLKKDGSWAWLSDRASHSYRSGDSWVADGVTQDITAQKKSEQDLRHRTEQLSAAQAIAHVGSFELDLHDDSVQWSDELYRIAGMEPRSMPITLDYARSLLPPNRDWRERLERDGAFDVEHEFRTANGDSRFVHTRAVLKMDLESCRFKVAGVVQDITEQYLAARELRERERRLQLIVNRLPVILWSTDEDLVISSLNGAGLISTAARERGLRMEDLFGALPEYPEDGPRAALNGETVSYDTRVDQRDLRVHVEPLRDEEGAIVGTAGIAWDTTGERRVERSNQELLEQLHDAAEEWRDTFDSIHTPIVIVDAENRVQRLNRPALTLASLDDYSGAIGRALSNLGEGVWQDLHELARQALTSPDAVSMQSRTEEGKHWELLATRSGRLHDRIILVASDITPVMTLQETLRRSERMSEMGALVAGVAHEVRNPLFGISATLDALEARFGGDAFSEFTAALRCQVDRMSQLMYDLLEYGRPVRSALEPTEIEPLVQASMSSLAYYARQHGVDVRAEALESIPEVRVDPQRILQVFDNVLRNAIEHSPEGKAIHIRLFTADRHVHVCFEDQGRGFAPDDLPRIYEPFFTRRRGGTGLGLSLVRRIVEEHNGRIRAHNRPTGGAAVTVTLPIARPSKDDRL